MDSRDARLSRRELALATLAGCVLAIAVHWPLPLHLGTHVARDIGDPLVQAWQVAWGGHALTSQPLDYFQANTFYPLQNSLAFSDALTGYAPSGLFGEGVTAAIVRYNLLFEFAYALAFIGAYLLARELGLRPAAAVVAGAAFAYAPWRLEQDGHLHVISSGGVPLALFLLLRGYRRQRPATVLAGWLVVTWQFSLGFTLGLQLGYLLAVLAAIAAVHWWREGRPPPLRKVVLASLTGVAVLAITAATLARPYQRVLDDHPEAHRTSEQVSGLSGPISQFAAAPEHNIVWAGATSGVRDGLTSVSEQTLFPGLVILALAIAGLLAPTLPKRWRIGLGVGVLVCGALSLGFHTAGPGRFYPYRLLYELAPGWSGIRVPGRINTLTSLGLALLAAGGAHFLLTKLHRRHLAAGVAAALVALICFEGAGPTRAEVPLPPAGERSVVAPQLHLPITIPGNRRYVLWSSDGFPEIVNGRGSFDPTYFEDLTRRVRAFPDRRSIALLRSIGVRSVVLHTSLATGTPWQRAELKSLAGLGVSSELRDDLIVYRLSP